MRLPTDHDYAWALQGLSAVERMQIDELVLEIVAAEVDGSSPDQIEALAHVFASHVLTCDEHLRGTGIELAACMFNHATRLREQLPAN